MTADTCPDCGAPVSERVDVGRHWLCGSRPAGIDYPARRSWACERIAHLAGEVEYLAGGADHLSTDPPESNGRDGDRRDPT